MRIARSRGSQLLEAQANVPSGVNSSWILALAIWVKVGGISPDKLEHFLPILIPVDLMLLLNHNISAVLSFYNLKSLAS